MSSITTAGMSAYRAPMPSHSARSAGQTSLQADAAGRTPSASALISSTAATNAGTSADSTIRQALDAGYSALGKAPSDTVTGVEWYKPVGFDNFSREELVEIMQNKTGEFTDLEMNVAKMNLVDRQADAMKAANPTGQDHAAALKAAIDFLDEAGPNEMGTLGWAQERASAQKGYELVMKGNGLTPKNVDSGNAIVALFLQGYDELSRFGTINSDVSDMPSYQKGISEWYARRDTVAAYLA